MASGTLHDLYVNGCGRKRAYTEHEAAMAESERLNRVHQTATEPYRCPFAPEGEGGHWHVGHPPSRRRTLNHHLSRYRRHSIEDRLGYVELRQRGGYTKNHWENNYREDVGLLLKVIRALVPGDGADELVDLSGGVVTFVTLEPSR